MKKYYVTENNSFGKTEAIHDWGQYVTINAEDSTEAILKFEKHFDLTWIHENSYEGNSCNCCGRRFTLYTPKESEDSEYDIMQIEFEEQPYFLDIKNQMIEL